MQAKQFNHQFQRPTWAEIHRENLAHNFRVMQEAVGSRVAIMPAVKANAYGHGAIECAQVFEREGAQWFGVALPEEASRLREAGITKPILALGGFWEGQEEFIIEREITPVMFRLDLLARLNEAAKKFKVTVAYHVKVDTGMGRLGVPFSEFDKFLEAAALFDHLRLDGLMTHFASADDVEGVAFTKQQSVIFEDALRLVRERGFAPRWIHQANSAATHAYPQTHGNLVRLGGVLYGFWRDATKRDVAPLDWRPVLSLHTRITHLKTVAAGTPLGYGGTFITKRESRIATLAIGYADGLRRTLSNRGQVLVRGEFAPIVGRISMDLTLVDVSDIGDATLGDEVVIIGRQGEQEITAERVAAQLETISYEVTCSISDRVPRVYK
ncbi:MAG: alanine racemase [Acidobacteria bacterium]|nr:alanine racemase [Acidobacteriota bacterium]